MERVIAMPDHRPTTTELAAAHREADRLRALLERYGIDPDTPPIEAPEPLHRIGTDRLVERVWPEVTRDDLWPDDPHTQPARHRAADDVADREHYARETEGTEALTAEEEARGFAVGHEPGRHPETTTRPGGATDPDTQQAQRRATFLARTAAEMGATLRGIADGTASVWHPLRLTPDTSRPLVLPPPRIGGAR